MYVSDFVVEFGCGVDVVFQFRVLYFVFDSVFEIVLDFVFESDFVLCVEVEFVFDFDVAFSF